MLRISLSLSHCIESHDIIPGVKKNFLTFWLSFFRTTNLLDFYVKYVHWSHCAGMTTQPEKVVHSKHVAHETWQTAQKGFGLRNRNIKKMRLEWCLHPTHSLSQTHITDFFVNCNLQGVLCNPTSEIRGGELVPNSYRNPIFYN